MPTALQVAHHYPPHVGGVELVVERQSQGLVEHGYRVIVLTSQLDSTLQPVESRAGIEVIRVACSHLFERLFFIPFPLFSPRLICEAHRQLKRADVVHIHDVFYLSSWVVALLAAMARKPILLTQHVGMVEHSSKLVMGVQRLVYATIGKWIFRRARRIVVYNENVRSFLRSRRVPDDRILRLANGIDTGLFRPAKSNEERQQIRARYGLPMDRPLVLFVGRLVEKKGYHILLETRDPAFDLVFVGPSNVENRGHTQGVHWLGSLDQPRIAEVFRACDVFAFPAVGEIFTLAMQEAMASGLPVVTTDDPAYTGSIVWGHVVLCRRDADSVKSAIQSLLSEPERLQGFSVGGRELALKHFNWHANFQQLMVTYTEVQSGGAA